ncbi:MAG: arginine--tRNA ligase [Butyrivibrio sp.]|uniref:arginine--tRNA ligase n=1 Tax=Butyrivibrio sp. TaxID=28121 RepID=UPI001B74CB71|nr:arginine--tRNA ligase [Butyrivibrio sp.]MBP3783481.1 arginine--tRNA ligase [Butyrivibrio sp.]MBP3813202.1 arginine--tRNA ligase [Butyrivibrio sp.]
MEKVLEIISKEVGDAFEAAGYERELGRVTISNRPDLCEYQCNGAMSGAKKYGKAPFIIADDVAARLQDNEMFEKVESVKPGFLNITVSGDFVRGYVVRMLHEKHLGVSMPGHAPTIILDYGGANVAKPLHVGHLRPAIIGEAVKRILKYAGNNVIGDIHMGDWGLQMGLIITELKERHPELPYFDPNHEGPFPKEPPFTIQELADIYPIASGKTKVRDDASDEEKKAAADFKAAALEATKRMQDGDKAYRAIWHHIMNVSIPDLKKNYDSLNVHFDLWKGESDVHDIIPSMVDYMKSHDYAHESQGALVVDVAQESDTKEMPPCIILKSDGAALYATTDLATIQERMKEYHPDAIYYFTDKRQALHFEQVFRTAKKTRLTLPETDLRFVGNGTMNGPDGKPFKTREGGVMHLESLVQEINEKMYNRVKESNPDMPDDEAKATAKKIALSALKYGDLSNQPAKDYIFDIDKFTSFEGDTGPYILYTIVRIKSILKKYEAEGKSAKDAKLDNPDSDAMKNLMLLLTRFADSVESAAADLAPNRICAYIYDLSNAFNSFYHGTKILAEEDENKKESYIALLNVSLKVLETGIDLLGFDAPERM